MTSKLAFCLRKLQDFNELEYSVGLSQDIQAAKEEIKQLLNIIDALELKVPYDILSDDDTRFLDELNYEIR